MENIWCGQAFTGENAGFIDVYSRNRELKMQGSLCVTVPFPQRITGRRSKKLSGWKPKKKKRVRTNAGLTPHEANGELLFTLGGWEDGRSVGERCGKGVRKGEDTMKANALRGMCGHADLH